ncbi:MAG: phosphatidylinositol-specific phospholipase C domain-containing protein [Acidobacteriaceae bacterium]|nr:phosphatidylinositol-specific phospholipase C domain-containing protein [Acidobacteriaceae bacterium]
MCGERVAGQVRTKDGSYHWIVSQWVNDPQSFFSWLATCAQSLDWLNMETYDYHGSFDPPSIGTGVNSPLLEDSTPNGPFSIKNSVESYLAAGISGAKINLGLPTYGRSYTVASPSLLGSHPAPGLPFSGPGTPGPATAEAGTLAYYEIVQQLLANTLTSGWDSETLTPYAYNTETGTWVSYDNEQSIGYKISYLLQKGLGGAMFWAIDDDAFPSMADAPHKKATWIGNGVRKDAASGFPLMSAAKAILDNPSTAPPLPIPGPVTAQNWMSALRDDVTLSRLTIPGTHETCARNSSVSYVDCQDLSLADQLNAGIRYLDIRCRQISDIFAIHHQQFYLGLNFGSGVRDVCINFLKANPRECILMQIKPEYTPANNKLTFQQVFNNYVQGFENYFYTDDTIPTLGDVRGKIVLVRRFSVDPGTSEHFGLNPSPWPDNPADPFSCTYLGSDNNQVTIEIQDHYLLGPSDGKFSKVQALIDQASTDSGSTFYVNFSSATAPASPPDFIAEGVNPLLYDYLAKTFANRLGVLNMDYPTRFLPINVPANGLIERIIGLNDNLKITTEAPDSHGLEAAAA